MNAHVIEDLSKLKERNPNLITNLTSLVTRKADAFAQMQIAQQAVAKLKQRMAEIADEQDEATEDARSIIRLRSNHLHREAQTCRNILRAAEVKGLSGTLITLIRHHEDPTYHDTTSDAMQEKLDALECVAQSGKAFAEAMKKKQNSSDVLRIHEDAFTHSQSELRSARKKQSELETPDEVLITELTRLKSENAALYQQLRDTQDEDDAFQMTLLECRSRKRQAEEVLPPGWYWDNDTAQIGHRGTDEAQADDTIHTAKTSKRQRMT